jgi:hypothetical protein
VITGTIALLLQTTVLHGLTGGRIIPDLILILCVYLGLHEHNIGGATGAFLLATCWTASRAASSGSTLLR